MYMWGLPRGALLWACLSASGVEAAQAGVRSTSGSSSSSGRVFIKCSSATTVTCMSIRFISELQLSH